MSGSNSATIVTLKDYPMVNSLESRMATLEARHDAHEVLCTERWLQARKSQEESQADLKDIKNDVKSLLAAHAGSVGQFRGAVMVTRAAWVVAGAAAASGAWIIKIVAFMR